jgi:mRNA interferase RelE/StbE
MYQLLIRPSAEQDVRKLPRQVQVQVRLASESLRTDPGPHGAKKMVSEFRWRLRVGNYRILYEIDDEARVVTIDRVRHRREVYR